jgi:hypothetical protein
MAIDCDSGAWLDTPPPDWIPPDLAARIDGLAPRPPTWLRGDEHQRSRWELCARVAAALAVHQQQADPGLSEAALKQFAWHCARSLFESEIRTGAPDGVLSSSGESEFCDG